MTTPADQRMAQIRTAILARLNLLSLGVLHNRERFSRTDRDLIAQYTAQDGVIAGGYIRRVRTQTIQDSTASYRVRITWRLQLYRSFEDAESSEHAFDAAIERVIHTFAPAWDLDKTVCSIAVDDRLGWQLDASEPVLFGDYLCHAARFSMVTEHRQDFQEATLPFVTANTKIDTADGGVEHTTGLPQ